MSKKIKSQTDESFVELVKADFGDNAGRDFKVNGRNVKPWEYISVLEIKIKELEDFLEIKTSENTWLKEKIRRLVETINLGSK
jgi:hypothetical protein